MRKLLLMDKNTVTALMSTVVATVFVAMFKISAGWPIVGGSAHILIFFLPMMLLIFLTSYRAFRKVNSYVAMHITDHGLIKRLAEKRIASFLVALGLSVSLAGSMAVFTYTMSWGVFAIVVGGFATVSWLISVFNFQDYLKRPVAEVSKGYVAVGVASVAMVVAYMTLTIFGPKADFDPMSPALIEHVRATVQHPNHLFESIARTIVFVNANILGLVNIEGVAQSLVIVLIVLTTSAVPFVALALFMRSLFESLSSFWLWKIQQGQYQDATRLWR